jgi:hypothetical protein
MHDPIGVAVIAIVVIGAIVGLSIYLSNNNNKSSKSSLSSISDVAPPTLSIVPITPLLETVESMAPSASFVPATGQSSIVPSDVPSDSGSGSTMPSSVPSDFLTYSPFFSALQPIQNGLLPPHPPPPVIPPDTKQ